MSQQSNSSSALLSANLIKFLALSVSLITFFLIWLRGGFASIYLDTDLARDLSELSNLLAHKIVWLGPHLSAGFPTSPIYYYLNFPFLWLAQGDPRSLILVSMAIAGMVLFGLGWLGWKKWTSSALLAVWTTAFSPWWLTTSIHPGNGYSYVLWLSASLVTLYLEVPLLITSLLLGIAIAHHPAAIFGVLLVLYEMWRRRQQSALVFQMPQLIVGLVLPWAPIIVFEYITKGYLLRQFLAQPETSYQLQVGLDNLRQVASLTGLSLIDWTSLWVASLLLASNRIKVWAGAVSLVLALLCLTTSLPSHYLLGIVAITWFISLVSLMSHKLGRAMVIVIFLLYARLILVAGLPAIANRSIPVLENTTNALTAEQVISPNDQLAVVSLMSLKAEVPQADDYRFFLRRQGYNVLEVSEYSRANKLIMFVEHPDFPWQTWSSWETEQFGSKTEIFSKKSDNAHIVVYQKNATKP